MERVVPEAARPQREQDAKLRAARCRRLDRDAVGHGVHQKQAAAALVERIFGKGRPHVLESGAAVADGQDRPFVVELDR